MTTACLSWPLVNAVASVPTSAVQDMALQFFPLVRTGDTPVICDPSDFMRHEQVQFIPNWLGGKHGFINTLCHSNITASAERNNMTEEEALSEDDD
jgi:hypothetical protein